jgi:hypothetical protein
MMAIIDDFKALNDALGRLQGKVPRLYNEPTNANAQPPCLPCGQAPPGHQVRPGPPVPAKCSYCGGYGRINHPDGSSKTYPCPGCKGSGEVSFVRVAMTDDERLEWCKQRALKYLDKGDVRNAICSMMSDMNDYKVGTKNEAIAMLGIMIASRNDEVEARRWIVGFR